MIPTLPLRPRNRLAEIILDALRDPAARTELRRLAGEPSPTGVPGEPRSGDASRASMTEITEHTRWFRDTSPEDAELLRARARSASEALVALPLLPERPSLDEALAAGAALFDAGVYFEVHELLEPFWTRAAAPERQALQGLIQIAVGYQHCANGNLEGARALLAEGGRRARAGRLAGLELGGFADAVTATVARLTDLPATGVPSFPRRVDPGDRGVARGDGDRALE